jgi:GGDEF domain-containing protein
MARAQALRGRCAAVTVVDGDATVRRTVSIGVASLHALQDRELQGREVRDGGAERSMTAATLLRAADEALHLAKSAGRDQVALAAA